MAAGTSLRVVLLQLLVLGHYIDSTIVADTAFEDQLNLQDLGQHHMPNTYLAEPSFRRRKPMESEEKQ